MQPGRLQSARSGDGAHLARGASSNLEKGLSGTYAVPSSAAIAERVQQLSLRRKKPAWATTGVSQDHQDDSCNTSSEEHSVYTSDPQHARHGHTPHAESAIDESAIAAANTAPHVPHVQNSTAASEASFGADNAASAAVATADSHSTPTTNSHGSSDRHSAHVRPHTSDAHHHAPAPKQGSFGQGSSSNSPAAASAKPAPSQMTFEAMLQRFQEPTLGSILRDSTIATESAQKVTEKAARAADDALPPFVTTSSSPQSTSRLHLDSKGTRSRPTSADDSLYGQHLESQPQAPHAELGVSSSRTTKASAYAAAKAMFSPSSTSRLSTTPGQTQRLQKGSSLGTFSPGNTARLGSTHRQAPGLHKEGSVSSTHGQTPGLHKESSLSSTRGPTGGLHKEGSLSSTHGQTGGLHKEGSLSSTHGQTGGLHQEGRLSSTHGQTGRLQTEASLSSNHGQTGGLKKQLSWADEGEQQWRSAAASYAAEALHPVSRSEPQTLPVTAPQPNVAVTETPTVEEEEEELDFETVPASWIHPSAAHNSRPAAVHGETVFGCGEGPVSQEVSSPAQQRLERFSSLARGNSIDGMRHSSRRSMTRTESFQPQVDPNSLRIAEGVYEQTQDLGPTPLQGRLNYLHQLGKVTLRDRRDSLNSLPKKREDMEFALCTFAPKLNKHTLRGVWAGSALERSDAWQARRNEKLHEMREQDADKDLRGCTFWPDTSASTKSLHHTLEVAAITRSLPEQEVLQYLASQHIVGSDVHSTTEATIKSMSSSLHDMHSDLSTYVSQMKYYERMQKVKERQQHVQEVLSKFDGSRWYHHTTKPIAPRLGQRVDEPIPSLAPPVRLMPGMIAANHTLRAVA